MDIHSTIQLYNGVKIPQFGFGVWQAQNGQEAKQAVLWALEAGYRHLDTAAIYHNEESVGDAIQESGVKREDIFLTTKVWNADIRADRVEEAFEESLKKLKTDYVDLYLIHWPVPGFYQMGWKALQRIYKSGRARAIGVSNFKTRQIADLLRYSDCVPMVNQMEFNPHMQDNDVYTLCREHGIVMEAYSPLGCGTLIHDKRICDIAQKYNKSSAQVMIRWLLQKGIVVFPKSVHKERIYQNADVFDFELSRGDMASLNEMNRNIRSGNDPEKFTH